MWGLKRAFDARGRRIATTLARGELSQETDTRLRYVQRLIYAAVMALGVITALSQFARIDDLADKLLASGAIVAAIVGFAARQTLANGVAGVMLAITQPIRVGDWVAFEDEYGMVEDVTLNFTILRTGNDQRIVIPNEKIASAVLRNDTLASPTVGFDVTVWIPADADAERAVAALADEAPGGVTIAEAAPWGTRLTVGGESVAPAERPSREAELRARCVRRLRAEGLLPAGSQPGGAKT